jgi:hypothetical protein
MNPALLFIVRWPFYVIPEKVEENYVTLFSLLSSIRKCNLQDNEIAQQKYSDEKKNVKQKDMHCTAKNIRMMYSQKSNFVALFPISICIHL